MKYFLAFLVIFVMSVMPNRQQVFGDESDYLPATVKIGICGDGVAEGVEDCDNEDLTGKDCADLGYASGILTCHPSCTFDETLCIPIPPTIPSDDDDNNDDGGNDSDDESIADILRRIFQSIQDGTFQLPGPLKVYDIDANGKLISENLSYIASMWLDYWKEVAGKDTLSETDAAVLYSCDLNKDGKCDLVDFSILMYYVDRENR